MGTLKPALWDSQVCFLSFLRLLSVFQQLEQLRGAVHPACAPATASSRDVSKAGGEGAARGATNSHKVLRLFWLQCLNVTRDST